MIHRIFQTAVLSLAVLACAVAAQADEMEMPDGFDKFVWAELQELAPADRNTIVSFDTIGDGTGALPRLPVARLGPDGLEGTADDLAPPEWVRLRGLLGNAQASALTARGEAALRSAKAAEEIVDALIYAICHEEDGTLTRPVIDECREFHNSESQ